MLSKDSENGSQMWFPNITGLNVKNEYIPFIISIITSIIFIFVLIIIYIIWRICLSSKLKKTREIVDIETVGKNLSNNPNYSTLFPDTNNHTFFSQSRIIELIPEYEDSLQWFYKNHALELAKKGKAQSITEDHKGNDINNLKLCNRSIILSPTMNLEDYSLPTISEFSARPCLYTPNNILDSTDFKENEHFRTRSLPSCVRQNKHLLYSVDNASELYDQVNFSKKRKNRMRNDEAAIIALSKSRNKLFNKDTDILIDNEAVIVYDERTAL